jgi:perosamine synthetase
MMDMLIKPPARVNPEPFLPFALPWIGREEEQAVLSCLRSGWITTGPRVREFEEAFAEYIGCRHAIAVNSCTAALHLALEAAGVGPGDDVLVPSMTFAATAEVVHYLGARPVLIDCDPFTLNLDVSCAAGYLKRHAFTRSGAAVNRETGGRIRAIVPVHFGGLPCAFDGVRLLAEEYGLSVVEDAAHALPASYRGRAVGTLGDAAAFSFYATKNITTGEGGMLTTDDDDIAARARMMSLHGISRDAWLRYTERGSWYYEIIEPGFKYNMTDLAAALGREQLRRSDALWSIRSEYARRYSEAFRSLPEVLTPPDAPPGDRHAWHLYVIQIGLQSLRIDRARLIELLTERRIGTSVHFIPLHLHPYYRERFGYCPDDLPVASEVSQRIVSLPLYPRMGVEGVDRVIEAVCEIVEENRR